jgi:hypothetical protein
MERVATENAHKIQHEIIEKGGGGGGGGGPGCTSNLLAQKEHVSPSLTRLFKEIVEFSGWF